MVYSYAEHVSVIHDFGRWIPREDNDCLLIECPVCERRMEIMPWVYQIYYRFCPYCGEELIQANLFSEMYPEPDSTPDYGDD